MAPKKRRQQNNNKENLKQLDYVKDCLKQMKSKVDQIFEEKNNITKKYNDSIEEL